jgi:hypothetical integral membrane protein (TIGR02206 family)
MNRFVFTNIIVQQKFKAFSLPHILFLLATLSIIIMLVLYKEETKNTKAKLYLRYTIAVLLFGSEASKQIADLLKGGWNIQWSLPLHLCGITSIICIIMLITKSHGLFEVMYFWSLIGSTLAMILPDLNVSYTSITFWAFMISHSMNIIAVVYMMIAYKYRPTMNSMKKTFIYTNVYMICIAGFNYIVGSQYYYFYLCKDPSPGFVNPFKAVTSWLEIILLLEVLTIIMLFLSYLPYYVKDYNRKKEDLRTQVPVTLEGK